MKEFSLLQHHWSGSCYFCALENSCPNEETPLPLNQALYLLTNQDTTTGGTRPYDETYSKEEIMISSHQKES